MITPSFNVLCPRSCLVIVTPPLRASGLSMQHPRPLAVQGSAWLGTDAATAVTLRGSKTRGGRVVQQV